MVRKHLHRRDIFEGFQVVFSPEDVKGTIFKPVEDEEKDLDNFTKAGSTVGTISYMPAVFGCHCASVVIRELAEPEVSNQRWVLGAFSLIFE